MKTSTVVQTPHIFEFPGPTEEEGVVRLVFVTETKVSLWFEDGRNFEVLNVTTYGDPEEEELSFVISTESGVMVV